MRRRYLLLGAFCAMAAVPAVAMIRELISQDGCLDQGGAWFSDLGCVTIFPQIDRVVIHKSDRRLGAYTAGRLVRSFRISLGSAPQGQKQSEGDGRTPEGIYPLTEHKTDSAYHRALRIGYPTAQQARTARDKGVDPGKDIMIHGMRNGFGWLGNFHRRVDWTQGCIALTNSEIDWLFQATTADTIVEIRP